MIVDDDALLLQVLRMLLENQGYTVITVSDGLTGLAKLREGGIDLVISDLRMNPMDGIEFLRKVREEHGNQLPVIMLTAYASVKTSRQAGELGAFAYLSKPFSNEEVISIVQRGIDSVKRQA